MTTNCTPLVSSFENYLAQTEASSTPVDFNPNLSEMFPDPKPAGSNDTETQEAADKDKE